jgi:NitT/TauT family transport system substrate-binding protein
VANSIVTSGKMIKNHPDRVKLFLEALLDAWEAAMDPANEAAVLGAVKKKDKGTRDDIRQKQLTATRKLIKPDKKVRIGRIDVAAWKQTEKIMLNEKQIKAPVNIGSRLTGQEQF